MSSHVRYIYKVDNDNKKYLGLQYQSPQDEFEYVRRLYELKDEHGKISDPKIYHWVLDRMYQFVNRTKSLIDEVPPEYSEDIFIHAIEINLTIIDNKIVRRIIYSDGFIVSKNICDMNDVDLVADITYCIKSAKFFHKYAQVTLDENILGFYNPDR